MLACGCGAATPRSVPEASPAAETAAKKPSAAELRARRAAAKRAHLREVLARRAAAERAQVPSTTTSLVGDYFAIEYPAGWLVEAREVSKGSYVDTTVRSGRDPNKMLRVDVQPDATSVDVESNARQLQVALSSQPGYREVDFSPTDFQGYDAVRWEFYVSEDGVLLHKVDLFFVDDAGNSVAVLTQAPAPSYRYWSGLFDEVRASFTAYDSDDSSSVDSAPDPSSSDTGFCDTHDCIDNFENGTGYIVQCADGMWSQSGGRPGACSWHGGVGGTNYTDDGGSSSGYGGDLGPGNGYAVTCADGSISHSGGIQGACSHHGGVGP
jgi:hypothetical protein